MNYLKGRLKLFAFASAIHLVSAAAFSASEGLVHLKAGESGLGEFLEMVSEKLDIQVNASGLDLKERISIPETGPLPLERAKALVLSSLYLKGYTWIYNAPVDLYRVLKQRDARDQEVPMLSESDPLPDSDVIVTYVKPIRHTHTDYIARNLRSFLPANSRIIPDEAMGAVLITDSAHNLSKLTEMIRRLDTPQLAKEAKEWLAEMAKRTENACPQARGATSQFPPSPQPGILILLFSLIALVIGFLGRGYVIRRIEGGL